MAIESAVSGSTFPLTINRIRLENFRSHKSLDLNLKGRVIFFTGPNGIGKTSLLEAISIASILKSFRNARDKDIIQWDSTLYTIDIEFETRHGVQQLHLGYGKHPDVDSRAMQRAMSINKAKVSKVAQFIGKFQTVAFSPDDTDIVDTTPKARRQFLDLMLSSLYVNYLEALQLYRKSLRIRSEVLKKSRDKNYIAAIDKEIAKYGSLILKKRIEFIEDFQTPFQQFVSQISNSKDSWALRYECSIPGGEDASVYYQALQQRVEHDLRIRQTTLGVHRDRITFHPPDREKLDLQQIGSQGQKRTVALALKMAQFAYTRRITHQTPILLIDDVLNELDVNRRKSFISFLHNIGQALITSTDLAGMEEYLGALDHSAAQAYKLFENEDGIAVEEIVL